MATSKVDLEITKHEREKISIQISTEGIPSYVLGMLLVPSAGADFSIEVDVDGDAYADTLGAQGSRGRIFTILLSDPVLEQLRSHRKKRINKKSGVSATDLLARFKNSASYLRVQSVSSIIRL